MQDKNEIRYRKILSVNGFSENVQDWLWFSRDKSAAWTEERFKSLAASCLATTQEQRIRMEGYAKHWLEVQGAITKPV